MDSRLRGNDGITSGVHIAPMMGHSHRHGRLLWRLLCPPAALYTEMLTAMAVVRAGDSAREKMLRLPTKQKPAILQLAAAETKTMAQAANIGAKWGYDAININCGCPSGRAQKGNFGACLMAKPKLAAALTKAAKDASALPVTVKCRIAIDNADAESCLRNFAEAVADAGADGLIVHARRALLSGLSPKQNRAAPPLDYETPRLLREQMPNLPVIINGGITNETDARLMLRRFQGVMIGRAAVRNPYMLARLAKDEFDLPPPSRKEVLQKMLAHARNEHPKEWRKIAAAVSGLFHGEPGAGELRRLLSSPSPLRDIPACL